jgi:hypothetical protein
MNIPFVLTEAHLFPIRSRNQMAQFTFVKFLIFYLSMLLRQTNCNY